MGQATKIHGFRSRYLLLFSIALIWGSQFLLNDLALQVFTPQAVSWLRAAIGFVILSGFLYILPEANKKPDTGISYWRHIIMVGFFEATLPFFLVAWGQQHVNSAIAAILMSLVAIFTLVLVVIFIRSEPVTLGKFIGIALGFAAVIVLLWPQLSQAETSNSLLGSAAILAAALSFAISLILIKSLPDIGAPVKTARDILFCGAIELGAVLLLLGQPLTHHALESNAIIAMTAQGAFAGGLVYVLYVRLVDIAGATFAGFVNYLVPLVGVLLGVIFLHNQLPASAYFSLFILILAIVASEWKTSRSIIS
ncbi:MAG TPA: DMT family transporter [Prochlorococcus sp.]